MPLAENCSVPPPAGSSPAHMPTELQSLIQAYVAEPNSGATFRALAQHTSGLIYHGALRKTNNPTLAEEALQNVLLCLSHKSRKLQQHPTPLAWIQKATSLESKRLMRREARHQRKVEALKAHAATMSKTAEPDPHLRDLLEQSLDHLSSKERELVLARHYEGKSYREIARSYAISEDASRMRVKRALAKLTAFLSLKGLSFGEMGTAELLSTQLVRPCPSTLLKKVSTSPPSNLHRSSFLEHSNSWTPLKLTGLLGMASLVALVGYQKQGRDREFTQQTQDSPDLATLHPIRAERSSTTLPLLTIDQATFSGGIPHEFLEELYQKHPKLRPTVPLAEDQTKTIIYDLRNNWELETNTHVTVDDATAASLLLQPGHWDQDVARQLVAKYQKVIERFLISTQGQLGFSALETTYDTPYPEIHFIFKVGKILNLAAELALHDADQEKAFAYRSANLQACRALLDGTIVQVRVAAENSRQIQQQDRRWIRRGITGFKPAISNKDWQKAFQQAVRIEFRGYVGMAYNARKAYQSGRIDLNTNSSSLGTDLGEPNLAVQYHKALNYAPNIIASFNQEDFFEECAKMHLKLLQSFSPTIFGDPPLDSAPKATLVSFGNVLRSKPPRLAIATYTADMLSLGTFYLYSRAIYHNKAFDIEVARQNALADGVKIDTLSDLVPDYLDKVPMNPFSQKAVQIDPETQELILRPDPVSPGL